MERHLAIKKQPGPLMASFVEHPLLKSSTQECAWQLVTGMLTSEVSSLAEKESGWHISANHAHARQLEHFNISEMSRKMLQQAPVLSRLIGMLLDSGPVRTTRQSRFADEKIQFELGLNPASVDTGRDDEDEYWWAADLNMDDGNIASSMEGGDSAKPDVPGAAGRAEQLRKSHRKAIERGSTLLDIVSAIQLCGRLCCCAHAPYRLQRRVVIISILMFTTNQKFNALAATMGMFFHPTSTPELVVEVFAHAGLSVSITTIHNMVNSLSLKACKRTAAQSGED